MTAFLLVRQSQDPGGVGLGVGGGLGVGCGDGDGCGDEHAAFPASVPAITVKSTL